MAIFAFIVSIGLWAYFVSISWNDVLTIKLIVNRFWIPFVVNVIAKVLLSYARDQQKSDLAEAAERCQRAVRRDAREKI